MVLKYYKPVTPGMRGLVLVDGSGILHKGKPYKPLVSKMNSSGGRNNSGRITVRHRGGGHKRSYRLIDYKRLVRDCNSVVQSIEYCPHNTAYIALVKHDNGKYSYILAPRDIKVGSIVSAGANVDILAGNALPLYNIPVGTMVHNVELKPGKGGQLVRSAGGAAQVVGRDGNYVIVKMPSGMRRRVLGDCYATVGVLSNQNHLNENLSKAGHNRWRGFRPSVRGVAMNPVDHPHGGGEGKTSGGGHPRTPWGKLTKGKKTRRIKFTNKFIAQKNTRKMGRGRV